MTCLQAARPPGLGQGRSHSSVCTQIKAALAPLAGFCGAEGPLQRFLQVPHQESPGNQTAKEEACAAV